MSNLQVISHWLIPIITFISASICILIAKKHIYRVALVLSSIALFCITISWIIPPSAGFIVENLYDATKDYQVIGEALNFSNNLTAIFLITGHAMLVLAFYKFRNKKGNGV